MRARFRAQRYRLRICFFHATQLLGKVDLFQFCIDGSISGIFVLAGGE